MVKIKICGITNWEDARLAVDLGADFLGFIFAPSVRQVPPEVARAIVRKLPREVSTVAVVRNLSVEAAKALQLAAECAWVQLHGDEPAEMAARFYPRVIKAFSRYRHGAATFKPYAGSVLLLDQPKRRDREARGPAAAAARRHAPRSRISEPFLRLARQARRYGKVFIAGGLDPGNVAEWVSRLRPYGVDVARGVEAFPGKKDPGKMRAFVEAARRAQ